VGTTSMATDNPAAFREVDAGSRKGKRVKIKI
jgi:hypothetical protein